MTYKCIIKRTIKLCPNFFNRKKLKTNYIWIREEIQDLCNEIINKYESMKRPFRAVMILAEHCYCCRENNSNVITILTNSETNGS